MRSLLWATLVACTALLGAACKGEPDDTPWCSAEQTPAVPSEEPLTYFRDAKPILDQKCARCHAEGGIAPFALERYEDAFANAAGVAAAIADGHMPPFLAARCCNDYFQDYSLTAEEISVVLGWVQQGAVAGDPTEEPPPGPQVGGLSRIDVELEMAEAYQPAPMAGTTDDLRCFVLDWPITEKVYVTGFEPVPGAREVVHHLIAAAVGPDSVGELEARDAADPLPGFDCSGGFGDIDWRDVRGLGGSLVGGDRPRNLGTEVEPGSKVVLNIHYSTVNGNAPDRTKLRLKLDDHAESAKNIPVANPAWLVSDAMGIEAGDPDAVFFYKLEPDLFTADERVALQGITPHMHAFGSKIVVRALHEDGSTTCLLEIPHWHFGWEQPFWLAEPIELGEDDELYIECHFDNSAENQPAGQAPRDIAWGDSNQDMCAAFVAFTDL